MQAHMHARTRACGPQGRLLLWGWVQEARKVAGTFTYAGCLCLPRELWLDYSVDAEKWVACL